jgi:MFS-type transporter involved in bile tolerance (Atg22 family)
MSRVWIVVDALIVLVFVVIGRSTHHHGLRVSGIVSTTWPFAVGLVLGWLCVVFRRQDGASLKGGVVIWLFTVIAGMTLRVLFGQGTALAFVFVALGFLGALMLGLRTLARSYLRRRRARVSV